MAERLRMADTNSTLVFQTYLAQATRKGALANCSGTYEQYSTCYECIDFRHLHPCRAVVPVGHIHRFSDVRAADLAQSWGRYS